MKAGIAYKLLALAVIGALLLGVAYKFRHRVEHFHLDLRRRSLETISISPLPSPLPKGASRRFTAIAHYRDGSQAELVSGVTWTSSDTQVLPITAKGIATAANLGTTSLQARLKKTSAAASVTGIPAAVMALAVSPTDETLNVNGESQLNVLATASDGQVEDVTRRVQWTSSTPAVASVTPVGVVRGLARGMSTIVAEMATSLGIIQTAAQLNVVSATSPLRWRLLLSLRRPRHRPKQI